MTQTKGGLGRGLSALLPPESRTGLRDLPLDEISSNPHQPRREFDEASIDELAASIRAVGVLQPVVVNRTAAGYQLVVGERRCRAARRAGLQTIPAIVRDGADGASTLRDALIENVQRQDLGPLEEAAAYAALLTEGGLTHEELASQVGKSRAAVTNMLRLLQLAPGVQQRLASGAISAAHGRAIAALADGRAQERLAARIVAEGLSVRATEEIVRTMAASGDGLKVRAQKTRAAPPPRAAGILEVEKQLSDILETRVRIEMGAKRGRIEIEFADLEDLDRIWRALTDRA